MFNFSLFGQIKTDSGERRRAIDPLVCIRFVESEKGRLTLLIKQKNMIDPQLLLLLLKYVFKLFSSNIQLYIKKNRVGFRRGKKRRPPSPALNIRHFTHISKLIWSVYNIINTSKWSMQFGEEIYFCSLLSYSLNRHTYFYRSTMDNCVWLELEGLPFCISMKVNLLFLETNSNPNPKSKRSYISSER